MRDVPEPGDWVVYRKTKFGSRPGPRAKDVTPAPQGELYSYVVEKYWVVVSLVPHGRVRLRTRTGKEHVVSLGDPNLRPARWWEAWLRRGRFRAAEAAGVVPAEQPRSALKHPDALSLGG